ncbi:ABC transporter substrate-binding protein [Kineosporia sp. NBRC 101731]|uniref:ABC transporter substrate-binding protein n=1 Tax=Kineosporia sp. NBRC 101731 TaxID=3032199 RepID=UPI00249F9D3C|nr:ABC transporter substrate-binding protein [Kineosporia sp. NBRC 101731]GLY33352.1 glycine/betaine ABC transporter substrate-binding protein [Kineosporia sp. NBRC 101731]
MKPPGIRRGRRMLALAVCVTAVATTMACSSAQDKGDFALVADSGGGDDGGGGGAESVTLIQQPWVDLQAENEISKQILEGLGYSVKVDEVSVELGAQAMSTGDADAYLGNWWPSQEPTYGDLIDAGDVEVASTILEGTEYAPAVPAKTAERLGITSLADLDEHGDEFGRRIYGIEAGSPGNETIQKAIDDDAYGLGDWKLVASGTAAMLTQVQKADSSGKAIVFLGWSPHWMTVDFGATFLEDPDKVWGGAGEIRTVSRKGWAADNPNIAAFLKNLTFTTDEAGQFYYDKDKDGKSLPDIAKAWINDNPDKVREFLKGVQSSDGQDAESVILK